MSTYEDYTRTSAAYDSTRAAVGLEIWLGHLLASGRPIDRLRLLDAGCGTGNYMAALAPYLGHVTAMDMNPSMLAIASAKLAGQEFSDRVNILNGSALEMPPDDGQFDAVMFNQVLHHLDRPGDENYPGCEQAIAEAARVVRTGGILMINACSRRQLGRGFWFYHLAPDALSTVVRQQAPESRLREILDGSGFSVIARTVPLEVTMMGPAYFDATGPLSETWRAGDSFWSLVDGAELSAALDKMRGLDAQGRLEDFVQTHDAERPHIGQMTFWVALKTAA